MMGRLVGAHSPRLIVSVRLPRELIAVLDAWAVALGATRSTVLRGLIEDGVDAGEMPSVPPTSRELLDAEDERLRELTRH